MVPARQIKLADTPQQFGQPLVLPDQAQEVSSFRATRT